MLGNYMTASGLNVLIHVCFFFREHKAAVHSMALTKSGDMIATGSADKTIKVLSLPSGDLLHTSTELEAPVVALALNSNCSMLVSASGKKVHYWNMDDMALLNTLEEDITGQVTSLAISADNIFLLLGIIDSLSPELVTANISFPSLALLFNTRVYAQAVSIARITRIKPGQVHDTLEKVNGLLL